MKTRLLCALALLATPCFVTAQQPPAAPATPPPRAVTNQTATARIPIEEAIRLALQHNHALQAARTTILQNQALETTANLRPNPVFLVDIIGLPLRPSDFTWNNIDQGSEMDAGVSYLFERGKKRQHRLQAAKDQSAVTRSTVADNERQLVFNVSQQFVAVLFAQSTVDFSQQDLDSFQKTVDISELRYKAGDMSEGDLLKIKLQMLQFQNDVFAAKLAKVQALASLRQFLGFESVPDNYDVEGGLDYQAVPGGLDDLKAMALRTRPDLQAAQQNVIAARSQSALAVANSKVDITGTVDFSHVSGFHSALSGFVSVPLPIFNRNQGEIARTRYVITQSEQLASETSQQVLTDVVDAYSALRTSEQIVQLYQGGYVDQAKKSRDISEYAYKRGAASLLDYLDSERTYRANQLAFRQALATYMTALEQMRQAVGTRTLP
jgi:cobalt-zinc-cadmium efflux system outer membrane protein